jgi:O-antigen ligase
MLGFIAMVAFIIGAVVAWVDKSVSSADRTMFILLFIGLACFAGSVGWRTFHPEGRW